MPVTYEKIASNTLGSGTTSVTFSSVSSAYTDIVLVCSVTNTTTQALYARFNGDTATNYSATYMYGDGSSASSSRQTTNDKLLLGAVAAGLSSTNPTVFISNIQNYSNTTTNKTVLTRASLGSGEVDAVVGRWASTSAISTILIYPSGGTLQTGSTFTLYGIKAA
jgi:hypothetical protein